MQEIAPDNLEIPDSSEQSDENPVAELGMAVTALNPALWLKNSEESRYLTDSSTGEMGIDKLGFQKGYMISELPTSLPIGSRVYRLPNEQSRMKSWSEMSKEERSMYADVSGEDESNSASIAFDQLTAETKQTVLANRLFDIHSKSKDPTEIQHATERNADRVKRGEFIKPTDLLHTTSINYLKETLQSGLVTGALLGTEVNGGKLSYLPYNLHLTKLEGVPSKVDASNYGELFNSSARYGNIGIIIDRSEGATDLGNEIDAGASSAAILNHELIFGGVPSTEIAAICVLPPQESALEARGYAEHNAKQETLSAIDSVLAHGEYIPVLDYKGNLALTKEEFDARRASKDYGHFVYEDFVPSPDQMPSLVF